jgi:hypothetical protein
VQNRLRAISSKHVGNPELETRKHQQHFVAYYAVFKREAKREQKGRGVQDNSVQTAA